MQTFAQLFALVLRDSGVAAQGQTPNSQMAQDAKTRCNMMLTQWMRRRWLVYHLVDTAFQCDGSLFYTVGTGQQINITRPDQIEAAYMRQTVQSTPNQVDYPLQIIHSYEDYSRIALKNLAAGPSWALFYDSGYPVGKAYAWPLANNQYALHLITKSDLNLVTNLTDDIIFPPEYEEAIYANLIIRVRMAFQLPSDPVSVGLAKAALETIRSSNFQIGQLGMPSALTPLAGAGYNIFNDRFGPTGR